MKPITAETGRRRFLDAMQGAVDYWSNDDYVTAPLKERMEGLIHSILCVIDGVSSSFDCAISLIADPCIDDVESGDTDWPIGLDITDGVHLHDEWGLRHWVGPRDTEGRPVR